MELETARYRLSRYVIRHRWLSLLIFLAVTIFFAVGIQRVELRTIFSDLLPSTHPFVQTYKDHPNFGNPLTVTVMVKRTDGESIYNPETLQKVWDMTRNIDLIAGVDHDQILSITTEKARYAQATPFGIDSQPLMGDHAPRKNRLARNMNFVSVITLSVNNFFLNLTKHHTIIEQTLNKCCLNNSCLCIVRY